MSDNALCANLICFDERRMTAMIRGDVSELDDLLAADLAYIHSNGQSDRKGQYLASLRDGDLSYTLITPATRRIQLLAPDIALVRGRQTMELVHHGKAKALEVLFTAIWRNETGHWRLYHWQSTSVV